MPIYTLTPAWQKIALAGQPIVVMNRSFSAAYIMTSLDGPPDPEDGLVLDPAHPSEQLGLDADLYARAPYDAVTLVVMGGISLGSLTGSTGVVTTASSSSILVNFVTGKATPSTLPLASLFAITRSGATKRALNATGSYIAFAANALAMTDLGLSIEPARINLLVDAENVGASPGAVPTSWSVHPAGSVSSQVVSSFVEDGLQVTRFRFFGTATDAESSISFGGNGGAAPMTEYQISAFVRLVSGAIRGCRINAGWYDTNFGYLGGVEQAIVAGAAGDAISACRCVPMDLVSPAATGNVAPGIAISHGSDAIDFTIDLATPVVEAGVTLTSPFVGSRDLDAISITGALLTALQQPQGTLVLTLNGMPTDAVSLPILTGNGTLPLLTRNADGSLSTAWGGAQATAAQPLRNWANRMSVGLSWSAGRVAISASNVAGVGADNAPPALTDVTLGSLGAAALTGRIEQISLTSSFTDIA